MTAHLSTSLSISLSVCFSIWLIFNCLHVFMPVYLSPCLSVSLSLCLFCRLSPCLSDFQSVYIPIFLSSNLSNSVCLSTYLCFSICHSLCLSVCLLVCMPVSLLVTLYYIVPVSQSVYPPRPFPLPQTLPNICLPRRKCLSSGKTLTPWGRYSRGDYSRPKVSVDLQEKPPTLVPACPPRVDKIWSSLKKFDSGMSVLYRLIDLSVKLNFQSRSPLFDFIQGRSCLFGCALRKVARQLYTRTAVCLLVCPWMHAPI